MKKALTLIRFLVLTSLSISRSEATVCYPSTERGRQSTVATLFEKSGLVILAKVTKKNGNQYEAEIIEKLKGDTHVSSSFSFPEGTFTESYGKLPNTGQVILSTGETYLLFFVERDQKWVMSSQGLHDTCPWNMDKDLGALRAGGALVSSTNSSEFYRYAKALNKLSTPKTSEWGEGISILFASWATRKRALSLLEGLSPSDAAPIFERVVRDEGFHWDVSDLAIQKKWNGALAAANDQMRSTSERREGSEGKWSAAWYLVSLSTDPKLREEALNFLAEEAGTGADGIPERLATLANAKIDNRMTQKIQAAQGHWGEMASRPQEYKNVWVAIRYFEKRAEISSGIVEGLMDYLRCANSSDFSTRAMDLLERKVGLSFREGSSGRAVHAESLKWLAWWDEKGRQDPKYRTGIPSTPLANCPRASAQAKRPPKSNAGTSIVGGLRCRKDEDCAPTTSGGCAMKNLPVPKSSSATYRCECRKGPVVFGCVREGKNPF